MTRRRLQPIACLLGLLLLSPAVGAGALPWERLLQPPAAAIAAAEVAVAATEGSEAEIAALLHALPDDDPHEHEATKLLAAKVLLSEATDASRALLERLAREEPALTIMVPGCREPLALPRYPYPDVAREALRRLDRRTELARRARAWEAGDLEAFLPAPDDGMASPAAWAAATIVAGLRPEEAAGAAEVLRGRTQGSPGRELLIVEAWLAAGMAPDGELLEALSPAVALEALRRSAPLPEGERRQWLRALARNGETQSAAALELARLEPRDASPMELLRAHGAEGALQLAREGAPGWQARLTEELAAHTPIHGTAAARHGALALMLDGSEAARAALEDLLAEGLLPPAAEEEVRRWLGSRPSS